MKETITIALVLTLVLLVGLLGRYRLGSGFARESRVQARVSDFLRTLGIYLQSGGTNGSAYASLISMSAILQEDLGEDALVTFRAPYEQVAIPRYPALINIVPEIHRELTVVAYRSPRTVAMYANFLQEMLIRYSAKIDARLADLRARQRNPLAWLVSGVQSIVTAPIELLVWSNAVSSARGRRIVNSSVVRIASVGVTLLGLLGSIIEIVLGWSDFIVRVRADWFR